MEPNEIVSDDNDRQGSPAFVLHKDSRPVLKSKSKPVAILGKRKYQSSCSSTVVHSSAAAASAAAVTTDAATQRASSAVVASMHSYAIPDYVHRPTKFTGTSHNTAASSSASCEDDERESIIDESNALPDTVKQPVSLCCLDIYIIRCIGCIS